MERIETKRAETSGERPKGKEKDRLRARKKERPAGKKGALLLNSTR